MEHGLPRARNELELRSQVLQLGVWLGWFSIVAVLVGLASGLGARHWQLLLALTVSAAVCNGIGGVVPWRRWLVLQRGQLALDLWTGGLVAFVPLLAIVGGSSFTLLLFLTAPFIAVVQRGWRRRFWLAASACTCAAAAAVLQLPAGATAMRLALVAAAVTAAVMLAEQLQREAATAREAHAELQDLETELERARRELDERKLIERAKGLLMTALRISEQDAFRTLQKAARDRNLRLADVARRIVESSSDRR